MCEILAKVDKGLCQPLLKYCDLVSCEVEDLRSVARWSQC